jgi:type II secretion system protein H
MPYMGRSGSFQQESPERPSCFGGSCVIRRKRGVSLVELILVIALVAIVSAVAAPRYAASASNYRSASAAKRLAADLEMARQMARFNGTTVTVTFSASAHQYDMTGVRSLTANSNTYTVYLLREPYRTSFTTLDLGGDTTLVFDRYGVPDSAFSIVLGAGGFSKTVSMARYDTKIAVQ